MKNLTLIKKSMLLLVLLSCGISGWGENVTVDSLIYSVSGKEATLIAPTSREIYKCTIPATITSGGNTYSVTAIKGAAFMDSFGAMAKCRRLVQVSIPSSVKTIGSCAFNYCTGLKSVTLAEGVDTLEQQAFSNCTSLTSIVLPATTKFVDIWAFSYCTQLSDISLLAASAYIADDAFSDTPWQKSLTNGLTYLGKMVYKFKGNITNDTTIVIKDGTTQILQRAFYNQPKIVKVVLPKSLKGIGEQAFSQCTGLTGMDLPDSITSIDNEAFINCSNLATINIPENLVHVGVNMLKGTKWLSNQPDGMIYINASAYGYKGSIPKGTGMSLKEGTVTLMDGAFADQKNLTSITFPTSLTTIGKAFTNCTGLTDVTIPVTVTSMADEAFTGCTSLRDLRVNWTTPPVYFYAGGAIGSHIEYAETCTLHVPANLTAIYKKASFWMFFSKITDPTLDAILNDSVMLTIAYYDCTNANQQKFLISQVEGLNRNSHYTIPLRFFLGNKRYQLTTTTLNGKTVGPIYVVTNGQNIAAGNALLMDTTHLVYAYVKEIPAYYTASVELRKSADNSLITSYETKGLLDATYTAPATLNVGEDYYKVDSVLVDGSKLSNMGRVITSDMKAVYYLTKVDNAAVRDSVTFNFEYIDCGQNFTSSSLGLASVTLVKGDNYIVPMDYTIGGKTYTLTTVNSGDTAVIGPLCDLVTQSNYQAYDTIKATKQMGFSVYVKEKMTEEKGNIIFRDTENSDMIIGSDSTFLVTKGGRFRLPSIIIIGDKRYYVKSATINGQDFMPGSTIVAETNLSAVYYVKAIPSTVDGIGEVQVGDSSVYYDLQGRRVLNPQKGIYIKNGRKVYIR